MNTRLLTPEDYLRVLSQRKWLIVCVIVVSLGVAWALCLWLPKTYRASTVLLVEAPKIPEQYVKGVAASDAAMVQDKQAAMLNVVRPVLLSPVLLSQVAEEFNLYGYEKEEPDSTPSVSALRKIRKDVGLSMAQESFLTLSFTHESPLMARDVITRLASLFVAENLKGREEVAEGTTEFLMNELTTVKAELEVKEKAIERFKKEHMGELPQQIETNIHTLDRLQDEQRAQSETELSLNSRLTSIDKELRGEYDESGPRRPGDPRLARLKELERSLFNLTGQYKESYPDVIEIRQEIKRLRGMSTEEYIALLYGESSEKAADPYRKELLKQKEQLLADLATVKRHQNQITADMSKYQGRVDRTPLHETQLTTLMRDYDNLHKNYQTLLDKRLSAGIAGNLEKRRKSTQYKIIDPATLPVIPETPNVLRIMLVGLGLGCALGVGSAVGLELIGRGFRFPDEAELVLGLPILASIPLFQSAYGGSVGGRMKFLPNQTGIAVSSSSERYRRQLPSPGQSRTANGTLEAHPNGKREFKPALNLVSMWRPQSSVAEQFRVAATRLQMMGGGRKSTVIVVTSALPGEGKSSTAINLGYVLAKDLGKKTVLVDGDLKRPMQHVYAGVELEPGLTEILCEDQPVDDCLQRLGDLSLWTLPAGSSQPGGAALSDIQQLNNLLTELRPRFDYIIMDAPPIMPLADMNVLACMADTLILVIRAGITQQAIVKTAVKTLPDNTEARIILNGIDDRSTPYYMQYTQETHYLATNAENHL
jgi:succinoglycan biosynthesis transport protein ExoP